MTNNDQKPDWFARHEESDLEHFGQLSTDVAEIKEMLKPVVETYQTVVRLGKWGKVGLGVLLLMLSIAVALKNLWPK